MAVCFWDSSLGHAAKGHEALLACKRSAGKIAKHITPPINADKRGLKTKVLIGVYPRSSAAHSERHDIGLLACGIQEKMP